MRYRSIISIWIALLISGSLFAQIQDNAGEYGFKFLHIPVSPASLALAGRAPDAVSNPAAFAIQPALNTVERQRSLGVSHSKWLADTDFTNVCYSYSTRRNHFGMLLRHLSYGEIEKRDDAGNIIGTYNPLDMGLMLNYSLRLSPSQYLGVNAGFVYEKLASASSVGFSTDLGYTWLPPLQDTKLSVAVRNLGLSSKMNDEAIDLPIIAELDLNRGFDFESYDVVVGGSLSKALDEPLKGTLHTEVHMWDSLILRAGYRINYSGEALSAGLGFRFQKFGVDYGWADSVGDLNSIHALGLSYHF